MDTIPLLIKRNHKGQERWRRYFTDGDGWRAAYRGTQIILTNLLKNLVLKITQQSHKHLEVII